MCHGYPPESVGGVEQHVDGLAHALVRAGHEVHVYARSSAPAAKQGEVLHGGPENPSITRAVYRWEGIATLLDTYTCAPMASTLRQFLAQRKAAGQLFDVAHVHHLTGMSTDSVAVLHEFGIPIVLTLHDYWLICPRGQMWHRREEVCERVEQNRCGECLALTFPSWVSRADGPAIANTIHERARQILGLATRLVIPSARALPPFLALGLDRQRVTVVENGVDTSALSALAPPPCGPGPLRLGYLGTVMPSKGLHILLDAVLSLPRGSVELHIYGNAVSYHGDDSFLTRCFQKMRPNSGIRYTGPYTTADLPTILGGLDVVCAPALWHEAFGLTVREALAAARPVLVSRVGGLQDAVVDGVEGRVLPPGDVAAWAKAIWELAEDRSLVRGMSARSRPRARGFDAMAADLLDVYEELAAPALPS